MYSVFLSEIVREFGLKVHYRSSDFDSVKITTDDIIRPGLQLAGFFDYFDQDRLQIIGKVEQTYVSQFSTEERRENFEKYFSHKVPALIISRGLDPMPECFEMAQKYDTTVLGTEEATSAFMSDLISYLKVALAPRITRHGVLVEVYGEGLLILGESGVGKSETAVELLKRGHRLIADDAVELKRVSNKTIVGTAPELTRHFIEIRGIGIIDVRKIFGMGAVKMSEKIDLVVNLEHWQEGKMYERLGLDENFTEILGLKIPCLEVPVKAGRNLALILEVAAMNNRNMKMGFNAARELSDRMDAQFQSVSAGNEELDI